MTDDASDTKGEPDPKPADAEPSSDAPVADAAGEKPKKPKKKKKPEAEDGGAGAKDPRAREIVVAFEAGDFARVRELGEALEKGGDPVLADLGRDYLTRVAVDPVQIAFLGLCAVAILTIAWIYVPH